MMLNEIAVSILISLSGALGIKKVAAPELDWKIDKNWHQEGSTQAFEASSSEIANICLKNPSSQIIFPSVIHGTHEILLDEQTILRFGEKDFSSFRSFYGSPHLPCKYITHSGVLRWKVNSYTKYFARIAFFPRISSSKFTANLFRETSYAIACGGLLILSLFVLLVFYRKAHRKLARSLAASCLFFGLFFGGTVAGLLGIDVSMLQAHRLADLSVWLGMGFFMEALLMRDLLGLKMVRIYQSLLVASCLLILAADSGDSIQLGTTLPFGFTLYLLFSALAKSYRKLKNSERMGGFVLGFSSVSIFAVACVNEIFVVTGILDSWTILSIGVLSALVFMSLAVNRDIDVTYEERDYLRQNLEKEVEVKTAELRSRTDELETTMSNLKNTQAELIQSAKLASLGTLSAGLAHEINNSINYVNGALSPLEKMVDQAVVDQSQKAKISKLFVVMKDGLGLTVEIIKSLRNYTGLNQAKLNDVNINEVIESVLTILRNKLRDKIFVDKALDENLIVFGSVVGLNQILMNLITNALDAMPEGGTLRISASRENEQIRIRISDTGPGIPGEIKNRIFDPFFTTKEVGKGTGLGLYIVKKEVDKHRGQIKVDSTLGQGTTFELILPIKRVEEVRNFAA